MKVNNKDFKEFNATVVSFLMDTMQLNNNIMLPEFGYTPVMGLQQLSPQIRTLVLYFSNEMDISHFTVEVSKECFMDIEDGYLYHCFLNEKPSIEQQGLNAFSVSYSFYVIKQKAEVTVMDVSSFNVLGNVTAEAVLEITSNTELASCVIDNYQITNLKADETFIIDGINKLIYYKSDPTVSAFDSINLTTFPRLHPGAQSIDVQNENVQVVVRYYPTYM